MAKQAFTFNTFANGLSNDPMKWKTHGFYSAGLDLVGIKDNGSLVNGARPNVLQLTPLLTRDAVSGSTVAGLARWIRKGSDGKFYAFIPLTSAGGEGLIVSANNSGWVSAKYTSAAAGGGGFELLSSYLYYGQDARLGQFDINSGTFNNAFAAFTDVTTQTPRPMKIFGGVLNIGNARYLATVDSTGTFTGAALTLPVGFIIRSLEVLGNYLVISADNGVYARIFLWTGGTATYQEAYDLPEPTAPQLVSREGRVFAIGNAVYVLNEVNFQTLYPFAYTGHPVPTTPPSPGSTGNWKNRTLYGLTQAGAGVTSALEAGGVYLIGQYDTSYPLIAYSHFLLPNQITSAGNYSYIPNGLTVGGIYTDQAGTVKIGFRDINATATSAQYGIASLDSNNRVLNSNYSQYVTLPLTMDTDNNKIFHSVRLNMTGLTSRGSGISVFYATDVDFTSLKTNGYLTSWTLLKTISNNDGGSQKLAIPIRKKGRNIVFRFLLNSENTNNDTPQLLDYSVVYEVLDSYR